MTLEQKLQDFIRERNLSGEIPAFSGRLNREKGQYWVIRTKVMGKEVIRVDYASSDAGVIDNYNVLM